MRLVIESTNKVAKIDGVLCRFWEGTTENNARCIVFVHRIAVPPGDEAEFDLALTEGPRPENVVLGGMR
jgi:hypothetical protein